MLVPLLATGHDEAKWKLGQGWAMADVVFLGVLSRWSGLKRATY